ncbi:phasin family protein [Micromonospora sp. NPDC047620]|uniref:phasin family protein n=1 Tax=Micromonospora sp. NPDC047620 TaxID=3364251 RepID=UPI00371278EC
MQDAWRAYLELAMGLTEAPRKKAQGAVRRLVGSGGATAGQLQALAEELVSTGAANREALTKLVRFEVDRALGAVGLATADEVAELTRRVHELERQLREARTAPAAPATPSPAAPATPSPAPGATEPAAPPTAGPGAPVATQAVAKKAVAKKAVAKKAVAKKAVAKRAPSAVAPAEGSHVEQVPTAKDLGADVEQVQPAKAQGADAGPARPVKKASARRQQPGGEA